MSMELFVGEIKSVTDDPGIYNPDVKTRMEWLAKILEELSKGKREVLKWDWDVAHRSIFVSCAKENALWLHITAEKMTIGEPAA